MSPTVKKILDLEAQVAALATSLAEVAGADTLAQAKEEARAALSGTMSERASKLLTINDLSFEMVETGTVALDVSKRWRVVMSVAEWLRFARHTTYEIQDAIVDRVCETSTGA